MKNIYYPCSLFHKAIKRNKPKEVYYGYSVNFWFYTQKAVLVYTPQNVYMRDSMFEWLKNQGIEVVNE